MARSNRTLTQFAVDRVDGYLRQKPPVIGYSSAGNTTVEYDNCDHCDRPVHIVVRLFGKEILRVYTSPLSGSTVAGLRIQTGDFYDSKGRPSRTTRERINGLLDFFCTNGCLPEGVRCFVNELGQCCIGVGESCKVFDQGNPAILLMAHPSDLVVA